jgi:hypothetical protein
MGLLPGSLALDESHNQRPPRRPRGALCDQDAKAVVGAVGDYGRQRLTVARGQFDTHRRIRPVAPAVALQISPFQLVNRVGQVRANDPALRTRDWRHREEIGLSFEFAVEKQLREMLFKKILETQKELSVTHVDDASGPRIVLPIYPTRQRHAESLKTEQEGRDSRGALDR